MEEESGAAVTDGRSRPIGPALSGTLMQAVSIGSPFIVAGTIKAVYDATIFFTFRRVRLPEGHDV